jgi:hypothetical protein
MERGGEVMTKEGWKELSPKQQWDIQVALRGPDCPNSEGLKWFTTAVIRGVMQPVMRVGGTINEDLKLIIAPQDWGSSSLTFPHSIPKEVREVIRANLHEMALWNSHHFFEHVLTAAGHLEIPIAYVSNEVWREGVKEHVTFAAERFYQDLVTNGTSETLLKEFTRHMKERLAIHKPKLTPTEFKAKYGLNLPTFASSIGGK